MFYLLSVRTDKGLSMIVKAFFHMAKQNFMLNYVIDTF